ncbi:16S rRNA methyltransferase [Hylemonella gracilis str. Niagara R]|uniref:Ribosomal RNA small subunit methyltransferase E n=1 Tax=Hylemonella gracilis str. Niagara R TaxID=1458275 RepID=A0A016XCQ8_9BURK|nr:16S rRNA (uracil(1498)-N(3))-methyltransferase [Hylemonella gracilis]EYC49889.1 16S rRNA methyltransferase [Hylemonella gracilis str. Niagara R]
MPRFFCPEDASTVLRAGAEIELPPETARHVQVLRLQPEDTITLFNGRNGEWAATILRMGRANVAVRVEQHHAIEREAPLEVHLAVGMPANERMDWLVEKAVELGAASIQPLLAERSVLRLSADRALKKQMHWQGIAIAACEQCGRNRLPPVHAARPLQDFQAWHQSSVQRRFVLSLDTDSQPLSRVLMSQEFEGPVLLLSGPEGGLSPAEEKAALATGFHALSLGPRTLRAETAPLAALAALTLQAFN